MVVVEMGGGGGGGGGREGGREGGKNEHITIILASFPDSTPQLFIAPCMKGAIKSWGVESGMRLHYTAADRSA